MQEQEDVLIVGGGPAGLSAALSLARLGLTSLVCDDRRPRNARSLHVNNFATRDGIDPAEWRRLAREDLVKYRVTNFFEGRVESVERKSGFTAKLSDGSSRRIHAVILADGIIDQIPERPGFMELWGKSIFHCPFCHGHEVRGQRLGLIASADQALHMLPMLFALSSDLTLFTTDPVDAKLDSFLQRNKIRVIQGEVGALGFEGDQLKTVQMEDMRLIERDALFMAPKFPLRLKSPVGAGLGCELNEFRLYKVGPRGETTIPGVFACGDNMTMLQSVVFACANGSIAGASAASYVMSERMGE